MADRASADAADGLWRQSLGEAGAAQTLLKMPATLTYGATQDELQAAAQVESAGRQEDQNDLLGGGLLTSD